MRRFFIFLFSIVTLITISYAGNAVAGTGYWADSPVQSAPVNTVSGTTIEFKFQSYESTYSDGSYWYDDYPANYYIQLFSSSDLTNPIYSGWSGGATSVSINGFQNDGATYYWRVYAYYEFYYFDEASQQWVQYSDGNTSWSSLVPFVNGNQTPVVPALEGVIDYGTSVNFSWYPAARADNYYLQVATDSLFSNVTCSGYTGGNTDATCPGFYNDGRTYYWHVKATNHIGDSSYSNQLSFINGTQKPDVPALEGVIDYGSSVDFSWYPAARADNYYLQVATDSLFSNVTCSGYTGGNTDATCPGFYNDGRTYYWHVKATNFNGDSSYSNLLSFVNGTQKPDVPALEGVIDYGTSVDFSWYPAARADNYYLQVATDSLFSNVTCSGYTGGNTDATCPGFYNDGRTYYWHVKATNFNGDSAYSNLLSFVNGTQKPDVPALEGVIDYGTSVDFSWYPAARADNYYLQVATDSLFSNVTCSGYTGGNTDATCPGFFNDGRTYYWHVKATNFNGDSAYSNLLSFVNGTQKPDVPALEGVIDYGTSVDFSWYPAARADNYYLQVATDASFNSIVCQGQSGGYTDTSCSGFLNDGQQYYWHVKAMNYNGDSAYSSPAFSFRNGTQPPAIPVLEGELDYGDTVYFSWISSARADNYYLQVATDNSFSNVVCEGVSGGNTHAYCTGFHNDGRPYYWHVKASNYNGETEYSSSGLFFNGTQVPEAPLPEGILDSGNTVSFSWYSAARADDYYLQVALDSTFGTLLCEGLTGGNTFATCPGFLDDGQEYYWHVRASNYNGYGEYFDPPQTFINGPSAPVEAPTQIIPYQNTNEAGTTVSFQWSPVERADDYRLVVTTSSSTVFYDNWLGNVDGIDLPGFTDNGESYTWQVQARNADSSGPISTPPWSFVNGPSAVIPDAPILVSPVNGTNASGSTISFTWGASARADHYVIQVATDPYFTHIVNEATVNNLTGISLDGFDNVGTVYYWHVAGVSGVSTGPYSSYAVFTNGMLNKNSETPETSFCSAACSSTNVATGALSHDQELFSAKGTAYSLSLQLFYNSMPSYTGSLGLNWSHSYDISLTENADGSVLLRNGGGATTFYTKTGDTNPSTNSDNVYTAPVGDYSKLVKSDDNNYVISYRDGQKLNFRPDGKIASIVDRYTNTIKFDYNTYGDLTAITDPAQRSTTLVYDTTTTPHRISSITDPNQKTYDFSYQGNALWKVINPAADPAVSTDRGYWEYQYDPQVQGFLKLKRDPNGNVSQYTYYADHKMEKAIDPEGIATPDKHIRQYVYPSTTDTVRTTTFTEKDSGQWLYTFDVVSGVLKSKTDPNNKAISFTYYANGMLKSKTEPKGDSVRLTTFYTYDSYGNILTQTDAVDLNSYTPAIDPEAVSDPATLASQSPPITPAISYTYDNDNYDRITSLSDLRSTPPLVTTIAYTTENNGDVVSVIIPANKGTISRYNPDGTLKEIIDANNTDVSGSTVTEKTGAKKTSFVYYPDTPTNRSNGTVGLLQSVTGPDGITTSISSYDKNGNPLEILLKDANGAVKLTSSQQPDALNRMKQLIKTTATLPSIVTKYGYDNMGNLNSLIDAETRETRYEYNYNRQVKKITDAKLNDTIFKYSGTLGNGVDMLTAAFDPNATKNTPLDSQPHTVFSYDKLNRLEYESDPLGKKLYYTYYDNGLLKQKYDATSATPGTLLVTYTYNNRGQITDKTFTDGTYEHYTYYLNGRLNTAGNQNITYTYAYYDDGRLHTVTDGNNRVVSYDQYDGLGQRKQVTITASTTDQRVIGYEYDAANRPLHITTGNNSFKFEYDNLGRRQYLTYSNLGTDQTKATYTYDDLNRLTGISQQVINGPVLAAVTYPDYDKVGNRLMKTVSETETYIYDLLYRLLNVSASDPEEFDYDDTGNRIKGPGPLDTGYVHNAANQMTTGRSFDYQYDNRGNQTARTMPGVSDKTWTHQWNYSDRLSKVEKVNGAEKRTVDFKYDPFGRRIEKKVTTVIDGITSVTTYKYLYDNDNIAYEEATTDNNPAVKTFYTHGPSIDEHLAMERGGAYYFYHQDGLGSVTTITDASHAVVQSYEYESYGMVTPSTEFENSFTHGGREWDKETGLYYHRERYRDPLDGTLLSKDPLGFGAGDVNVYQFVQNNPVNRIDPTGLMGIIIEGMILLEEAAPAIEAEAGALVERYGSRVASGAQSIASKGFSTFNNLKNYLGSPGANNAWHHIVEKCQIAKSGFLPQTVHNINNTISVDNATHAKISGYYNSVQPLSDGLRIRDWLAGQSLEFQFKFGLDVLKKYNVIK